MINKITISWLGAVNFIIIQWFFVRLAKVTDTENKSIRWTFIGPILPLTGWWSDYKWL